MFKMESNLIVNESDIDGNFTVDNDTYDYYYDYDNSVSNIPLEEILPLTMAYGITLLVGILGNFLVIFAVCRYKRLRSITNTFLTSLAIADLLLLLICIPIKCAGFMSFSWSFGEFLCKFVNYMQTVSMICSVMTLTIMSIERWVAILYPLKAKYLCTYSHARLVIVIIWTTSGIMAVPVLIGQKHLLVGERIKAYWCIKQWSSEGVEIVFEVYRLIVMFIIPMTVMIVAYTGICRELLHLSVVRHDLIGSSGKLQNKKDKTKYKLPVKTTRSEDIEDKTIKMIAQKYWRCKGKPQYTEETSVIALTLTLWTATSLVHQVIQMLIVVVVLFAICWGPILINHVLVAVGAIEKYHYDYLKPMRQAFFLMSYFNSCSNPIVYGFMSKHFRQGFKKAIMSCLCCPQKKSFTFQTMRRVSTDSKTVITYRSEGCSNRVQIGTFYRNRAPSPITAIRHADRTRVNSDMQIGLESTRTLDSKDSGQLGLQSVR